MNGVGAITKINSGAIMYHATGANFDNTYGTESTSQTGAKIVWTGTATDATGKTMQVRDTNVFAASKYTDLGEVQSGGSWKPQYNVICTKS